MQLRRVATTERQLLTLDHVKDALGLGWPDDQRDRRIESQVIPAVIAYAEDRLSITLQQTTWEYIRTGWPDKCEPIELPRPPTLCLTEFVHSEDCDDWARVAEEDFRIQESDTGMLIYPCDCWPIADKWYCERVSGCAKKIRLTYEAGYQEFGDVPATLREGLLKFADYLITLSIVSKEAADQLLDQQSNLRSCGHYG